ADFSKELTTAVLWLNERDLDVRCVRLKPYALNGEVVLDAQQVVPLPEAEDYTIQLKNKTQAERQQKSEQPFRLAFWKELLAGPGQRTPRFTDLTPGDKHWFGATTGFPGLRYNYLAFQHECEVELYIETSSGPHNKLIYDRLRDHRAEI